MRTATIERYHVYGTHHHMLALLHRGRVLTQRDDQPGALQNLQANARNRGFTHVLYSNVPGHKGLRPIPAE